MSYTTTKFNAIYQFLICCKFVQPFSIILNGFFIGEYCLPPYFIIFIRMTIPPIYSFFPMP